MLVYRFWADKEKKEEQEAQICTARVLNSEKKEDPTKEYL